MQQIKKIKIEKFNYPLPEERIAKYPLKERDQSNLLIYQNGTIRKDRFKSLPEYLPQGSLLVFNNTRVIHARLMFQKSTGARIEIFCLEPVEPGDYQLAFQEKQKTVWKCMVGNAKKWKTGVLEKKTDPQGNVIELKARRYSTQGKDTLIEFTWNSRYTFAEIIEKAGIIPIPPYLNRETEPSDERTYQTVYAKENGSVAAPTAGLHFTEKVLHQLQKNQISLKEITLHVGAGTFRPVKSETLEGHDMHHEQVVIPKSFIHELINQSRKIIAVGTTTVRSLESLYWIGLQLEKGKNLSPNPTVSQWEPYENNPAITPRKALQNIYTFLEQKGKEDLSFSTQVIIVPGYRFMLTEGMITNFHQPQSTLLLLIGAFLGDDWEKVYAYALNHGFRFLSYGDSNLYLK